MGSETKCNHEEYGYKECPFDCDLEKPMTDQEINKAVARKLGTMPKKSDYDQRPPDCCHDIKAAWEIVEFVVDKIQNDGDHFDFGLSGHKNDWLCVINELADKRIEAEADTAPMAICKAFLKLP